MKEWNVSPWSSISRSLQRSGLTMDGGDQMTFTDWWKEYDPPNTADFVYDMINGDLTDKEIGISPLV